MGGVGSVLMNILCKRQRIYFCLGLVGFFLLGVVHVPELWSGGFVWDESFSEYIPWRVESARQLTQGHFPFFTSRVFGGMPLFATSYNGILYPPNWLYCIFGPIVSHGLLLFHFVLGGAGMYCYLRSRKLLAVCSFIGSMFFLSSTFFLCHKSHISMVEAGLFAPWVVYFARKYLISGNLKFGVLLSLFIAVLISIGYQQLFLFSVVWIGFEWLSVFRFRRDFYVKTGWLALAGLAGTLLMAVQILPAVEMAEYTPREGMTFDSWTDSSFSIVYMPLFLCGRVFGFSGDFLGQGGSAEMIVVVSSFVWTMMIFFLTTTLFSKKYRFLYRRWVLFFGSAVVVTFLLSLGHHLPGYEFLFHLPPFNMFRVPARWLYLVNVFGIIMGMGGLQMLLHFKWWKRFPLFLGCWGIWCSFCLFLYSVGRSWLPDALPKEYSVFNGLWLGKGMVGDHLENMFVHYGIDIPKGIVDGPAVLWVMVVVLGVFLTIPRRWFILFSGCVVIFLIIEKGIYIKHSYWGSNRFEYVFSQEKHPLLCNQDSSEIERIYSLVPDKDFVGELSFPGNSFLFQGFRSLNGYCPLINDQYSRITGMGQAGCNFRDGEMLSNPNPLKQLAVSHLFVRRQRMTEDVLVPYAKGLGHEYHRISWAEGYDFVELERARPRFDFAKKWRVGTDSEVWNAVWDLDPSVEGVETILENPRRGRLPEENSDLVESSLSILNDDPSYQKLEVTAGDGGAVLLVRDVWWPGWKYRVTGDKDWHRVRRANGLIRYVPVSGGKSVVEMKYVAPGFRKGMALSILGLLMVLGMGSRWWFLRKALSGKYL